MDTIPIHIVLFRIVGKDFFLFWFHVVQGKLLRYKRDDVENFYPLCSFFGCIDWCQGFGAFWHIIFSPPTENNCEREKEQTVSTFCMERWTLNISQIQMRSFLSLLTLCARMWNCLKRCFWTKFRDEPTRTEQSWGKRQWHHCTTQSRKKKREKYQIYTYISDK